MVLPVSRVGVAACGQTVLSPSWRSAQHIELIYDAVRLTLVGTPFTIADVDFVIDCGSDVLDGRSISNCGFLGAMGAHHKEESRVEDDGLFGVFYAWQKILSGHSDVGLVIAYSKPSESDVDMFWATQTEPFFQRPVGLDNVVASALQAQQYLERTGTSHEAFASVAAHDWANAASNPRVDVERAPTEAEIAASAETAPPLTEATISRYVDGAAATLLVSERIARKLRLDPVWILGMGSAMDEHMLGAREPGVLAGCVNAGDSAFRIAQRDRAEVDLVEVSAPSAAGELMALEALGLAADGEGASLFADSGVVVNPSGGALPADPLVATGLIRFDEAALQLFGTAGGVQVDDPRVALVHGSSGVGMQNTCVALLGVD